MNLTQILKKYESSPLTFKATIWFTICNLALKVISFFCMPLYTRLLSPSEYGTVALLTSYETIFIIFATFEIYLGAYQRGILKFKADIRTFEQTIVLISNVLTIIWLILVTFFFRSFFKITGVPWFLYVIMAFYFLGYAPYNCWLNKKRFDYEYKPAVIATLTIAILANLLPIFAMRLFGYTAFVKVSCTFLVSTVLFMPFWIYDFSPRNLFSNIAKVKEYSLFAFKFQSPLVFHSLSYYILNHSDRVMIDWFSDSTKVAFYSVAYSLAMVIILVQSSLNQVLKPWRYKKLEDKKFIEVRNLSNFLVLLIGVSIVMFMLVVPEVFKILFTENYYEALKCMPPITMSVYFLFLYTIFVDIESYYGKTKYIAYVSVSCALLNILLNYYGLQWFSYISCAYTTLICYVVMAILHFLFMRKVCQNENVEEFPVDNKFICFFSISLFVFFLIINFIYDMTLIRYGVFLIILLLVGLKRKKIIGLILQLKREPS